MKTNQKKCIKFQVDSLPFLDFWPDIKKITFDFFLQNYIIQSLN